MGHQPQINSDEAVALATELATLTGKDLDAAVTEVLRTAVEAVHASRRQPVTRWSDDELYDRVTGLPR